MPEPGQLTFAAPRRAKPPAHLADMTSEQRRAAVVEAGEPAFRADQLSRHYFARHTSDPAEMTDLPAGARASIAQTMLPPLLTPVRNLECDDGQTRKTLWRLFDGALVESVLMRYGDRRVTVCVSSQAGCGMNCPFCATGQAGLTRNMSAAEIVEQVVAASRMLGRGELPAGGRLPHAPRRGSGPQESDVGQVQASRRASDSRSPGRDRISNVVFMGMGEPLANYKAVATAVRRITDAPPAGLGIKQRGVTVSTVGLVPAIDKLAAEDLQVTLALSLHAPDDELRDELVPINTRWNVAETLDAARRYFERTGRRVSIEYALIRDINDQAWRADLLGRLLAERRGRGPMWVHVNPIPLNPTPGSKWTASDPDVEREFVTALEAHRIPVTIRDTRGREIDGACGQLAAVDA